LKALNGQASPASKQEKQLEVVGHGPDLEEANPEPRHIKIPDILGRGKDDLMRSRMKWCLSHSSMTYYVDDLTIAYLNSSLGLIFSCEPVQIM
jgi:hypothetical protein